MVSANTHAATEPALKSPTYTHAFLDPLCLCSQVLCSLYNRFLWQKFWQLKAIFRFGQSDALWLIQSSLLLDSGSFSCFGSTSHWIWNETRSMRFHLLKTRLMLKFPQNHQELKMGALQRRIWFKIVHLSKYLYRNIDVLHSLCINTPEVNVTLCTKTCWA